MAAATAPITLVAPASARAQANSAAVRAAATSVDTLHLYQLQQAAVSHDARSRQLELLSRQSALRQRNLSAELRPSIAAEGQAQYQSDVVRIPITLPGGLRVPSPAHDTYDARVALTQRIYDPGLSARRAVEGAQLEESRARVQTSLFGARQHVADAFFAALRVQEQIAELRAAIADLDAQARLAAARVAGGTALPSEELVLRSEVLRRRQILGEAAANREAALAVLGNLTGRQLDSLTILVEPELADVVGRTRAAESQVRSRPEYEQFARSRAVLDQQMRARSAQEKPRVSAFGRVGYGRPGLNPLGDEFDSYWLGGVMLQWTPWTWGTTSRDRQLLELQREIISADEAAFTDNVHRAALQHLASIDRLAEALATDDEIIALRERIATEARVRFGEGVITAAEYVDRQTDVLSARISRALHRVELAQARAHYLTLLGVELR